MQTRVYNYWNLMNLILSFKGHHMPGWKMKYCSCSSGWASLEQNHWQKGTGAWKLWVQEYLFPATIMFSNTTCTHLSNLELLWTVFWLHYRFLSFCTGIAVINLLNILIILYYCMYSVYSIVKLLQIKKKFPLLVHMTIDLSWVKYREFSARVGWRIKVGE